jgi:hypothetical protein
MKKNILIVGACSLFLLVTGLTWPGDQLQRQAMTKKIVPHISSVSQSFDYPLAIYLIVDGTHFPPKTADNNIRRNIRLVTMGGAGDTKGFVFYTGETGNWTSTRIDDFVGMEVLAGRKYRVGLVEFVAPGPNIKKLISNEVEFLLLMKLDTVTPNPVPHGTTEVEVTTTNALGVQGSKIVKLGDQPAVVTQWGGPTRKFKFRIPSLLAVPGIYELYVEENGIAVSNKFQVRLLGSNIKPIG